MKTTIRGLIKQHLIKVCKEKTALMRERLEIKSKKSFGKKKVEEAYQVLRKTVTPEYSDAMFNALAVLFDAPELNRQVFPLEVLGVIVLEKNLTSHSYLTGTPLIITANAGGVGNKLFATDGRVDVGCQFTVSDEPRPATDAEVETCINNLTDKQWSVITNPSSALFAPLMAEAMANEVEVLEIGDHAVKEAGDEIESNGRRITIGKE